jgi:hypothetical protein
MGDFIKVLQEARVPAILIAGGIFFLFLAIGGQFGATIITKRVKLKHALIVGVVLLLSGFASAVPIPPPPNGPPTPTPTLTPTPSSTPAPTPTNTPTPTPVVIDTMDSISGWSICSDTKSTIEIRPVRGTIDDAIEISYTLTATLTANSGNWVLISRPVNMQPLSGTTKGIRFFCSGSGEYNAIELKLLYAPDAGQSITFVKLWPAATVADWRSLEVLYTEFDCGETCPPGGQLELGKVRTINFAILNAQGGTSGSGTVAIDHVVGIR